MGCCIELVSPYFNFVQIILYYLIRDRLAHSGYFEIRIPLKPMLVGSVYNLVNNIAVYEET